MYVYACGTTNCAHEKLMQEGGVATLAMDNFLDLLGCLLKTIQKGSEGPKGQMACSVARESTQ